MGVEFIFLDYLCTRKTYQEQNKHMERPTKVAIGREIRDYVMITIAMLSYCIGWAVFLLPNTITTGGVAGLTSVLYWATGIPVTYSYFVINAILLLFALKILGWKFCVKTVFAVSVLTVAVGVVTEKYTGHLLSDQPFMAAIIGAVFCGCVQTSLRPSSTSIVTCRLAVSYLSAM